MNLIKKLSKLIAKFIESCRPKIITTSNINVLNHNEILEGRRALITGGASGIGLAIAKAFVQAGASVVITGRNEAKLQTAISELNSIGRQGITIDYNTLDISDNKSMVDKLSECQEKIGKQTFDILVNSAGISSGGLGDFEENRFDRVFETNVRGCFMLSQLVANKMKDNNIKGNILNISSSSALRPAISAYMMSKWSIRGMTLGLAKTYIKYGIVVNGIAPGPTATEMLHVDSSNISLPSSPIKRYILPEEIANFAVMLVSNMGRSIVGDTIYMTGGCGTITFDDINY